MKMRRSIIIGLLSFFIAIPVLAQESGINFGAIDWIYDRLKGLLRLNTNIVQVLIGDNTTATTTGALLEIQSSSTASLALNNALQFSETTTPEATPSSGTGWIYLKDEAINGGELFLKTDDGTELSLVSGSGGGGSIDGAVNVGTGEGVFKQVTGSDLEFKSLVAGSNITITDNGDDLTIESSAGGAQTPWTDNIDGAGFNLANAGDITAKSFTATNTAATSTFTNMVVSGFTSFGNKILSTIDAIGDAFFGGIVTFTNNYPVGPGTTPTTSEQLVDKAYVDNLVNGLSFKDSAIVATTGNITLSGLQTIDGYLTIANDRVLVKNQSSQDENGCYVAAAGAWSRCADYDETSEVFSGTAFLVIEGTTQAATQWVMNSVGSITVGTDPITFAQVSAPQNQTASLGVQKVGNDFRADLDPTGGIELNGDSLRIGNATVTDAMLAGDISWSKVSKTGSLLNDLGNVNDSGKQDWDILSWDNSNSTWIAVATPTSTVIGSNTVVWQIIATPQTNQVWTNQPAAETELFSTTLHRGRLDLTNAYRYRIVVNQGVAGVAGADINLECSTDNSTFIDADSGAAAERDIGTGTGLKIGNWATLVEACRGDRYLRIVGKDGNATADPAFRGLRVEFGMVPAITGSTATSTLAVPIIATPQTAQAWTNMPLATTELFSTTLHRQKLDLRRATKYRILATLSVASAAGADLNLQYSTDNSSFSAADTAAAGELDISSGTGNIVVGSWADLADGAKGDVWLRIVGKDGNGAADPAFRQLVLQFEIETDAEPQFSFLNPWDYQSALGALTPTSTSAGIFVRASSTIDSTLRVTGNVTSTSAIHAPEFCLNNDCVTAWASGGGGQAWEQIFASPVALTPTTSGAGFYVTGSSTVDSTLRITGNATSVGSFSIANNVLRADASRASVGFNTNADSNYDIIANQDAYIPTLYSSTVQTDTIDTNGGGLTIINNDNGFIGYGGSSSANFNHEFFGTVYTDSSFNGNGSGLTDLNASNINSGILSLTFGGTGATLPDPNNDRILFWDDSAGQSEWLSPGTGLSISGTLLSLTNATPGSWQWNGFALTPTSSSAGIFVNASSTINANFRVAGNATTTGSFYAQEIAADDASPSSTIGIYSINNDLTGNAGYFGTTGSGQNIVNLLAEGSSGSGNIGVLGTVNGSGQYGVSGYYRDGGTGISAKSAVYGTFDRSTGAAEDVYGALGYLVSGGAYHAAGVWGSDNAGNGRYAGYFDGDTSIIGGLVVGDTANTFNGTNGLLQVCTGSCTGGNIATAAGEAYVESDFEVDGETNFSTSTTWGGTSSADYPLGSYRMRYNNSSAKLQIAASSTSIITPRTIDNGGGAITAGSFGICTNGNYAYTGNRDSDNIRVYDITNKNAPQLIATLTDATNLDQIHEITCTANRVYAAGGTGRFAIIDVSIPAAPKILGTLSGLGATRKLYVQGEYVYLTDTTNDTLRIIDVRNSENPVSIGTVASSTAMDAARGVYVQGDYAYVTGGGTGRVAVVDVTKKSSPSVVGNVHSPTILGTAEDIACQGRYCYTVGNDYFAVINVATSTIPTLVSSLNSSTYWDQGYRIVVSGNYAYTVSPGAHGLPGNEYMTIVDISVPTNPVVVGTLNGDSVRGSWLDPVSIDISGSYAYVTFINETSFAVIDLFGIDVPNVSTGNLEAGNIKVLNDTVLSNNAYIGGSLRVTGHSSFNDTLRVNTTSTNNGIEIYALENDNKTADTGFTYDGIDVTNSMTGTLTNSVDAISREFTGLDINMTDSGATTDTSGSGTEKYAFGLSVNSSLTGSVSGSGNWRYNYGVFSSVTGSTNGDSVNYAIYGNAGSADVNWAGYFVGGNVRINNQTGLGIDPATGVKLDIDAGSNTQGVRLRGTAETAEIADIYVSSAGQLIFDTTAGTDSSPVFVFQSEVGSNSLLNGLQVGMFNSAAAGGTNLGTGLLFQLEDSSNVLDSAASLKVQWTDATNGSEDSVVYIEHEIAGTATRALEIDQVGYVAIGDAGTVNAADGNGDLYIEGELEVDGLPSTSGGDNVLCYNVATGTVTYDIGAGDCSGAASPFLMSIDGQYPIAEVLANQWKIEANSVNRIYGYDGGDNAEFILASLKQDETDWMDSITMNLRCEQDHITTVKSYNLISVDIIEPHTNIGRPNTEEQRTAWLNAAKTRDGQYLTTYQGDYVYLKFEQPQAEDYKDCDRPLFTFDTYGYYDYEHVEFDNERIQHFWEQYQDAKKRLAEIIETYFTPVFDFITLKALRNY